MTAVYVGALTIGGAVPGAGVAASAGADGIEAAFPDLAGRLAALQAQLVALATMPPLPSFADMLAQSVALTASIQLALATPGLPPPPSIASSIAALAALVTSLTTMTASLHGKLGIIIDFQTLLAAAGVHVVAYDGAIGSLGTQVQAAVAGPIPSGHANAIALITTDAATWSAMAHVFKVTP